MRNVDWLSTQRPQKAVMRHILMSDLGRRPKSLWLPGEQMGCVRAALEAGVLATDDPVVLVERIPRIAKCIEDQYPALVPNATLFVGELSMLPIDQAFDYAFIDLIGALNEPTTHWLRRLIINRNNGFVLDLAILKNWRNNDFMHSFSKAINNQHGDLVEAFINRVGNVTKEIIYPMILLSCVLHDLDLGFERPWEYGDNRNHMVVLRLSDIREGPNPDFLWPSLDVIMRNHTSPSPSSPRVIIHPRPANKIVSTRSAAAHKAWATRRANSLLAQHNEHLANERT